MAAIKSDRKEDGKIKDRTMLHYGSSRRLLNLRAILVALKICHSLRAGNVLANELMRAACAHKI